MQEFSLAFSRVSRSTLSANPELKNHVSELFDRAYFNLHANSITTADPLWASSLNAAGLQLCLDERVRSLSPRELVRLFENVIRISEEHQREARRHAAMASNVFYLKETALDSLLVESSEATFHAVTTTLLGGEVAHTGRVDVEKLGDVDA